MDDKLLWILVFVIVFMICRHLILWYWRINEAVNLLASIDKKLDVLVNIDKKLEELVDVSDVLRRQADSKIIQRY